MPRNFFVSEYLFVGELQITFSPRSLRESSQQLPTVSPYRPFSILVFKFLWFAMCNRPYPVKYVSYRYFSQCPTSGRTFRSLSTISSSTSIVWIFFFIILHCSLDRQVFDGRTFWMNGHLVETIDSVWVRLIDLLISVSRLIRILHLFKARKHCSIVRIFWK